MDRKNAWPEVCTMKSSDKDDSFMEQFTNAVNEEQTLSELAKIMNCSENTVRRKCKKLGLQVSKLKSKRKKYDISKDEFIRVYNGVLEKGGTVKDIAEKLNCSERYVLRKAKEYGLPKLNNWGGYRKGAGRPEGSENEMIEHDAMLAQLKKDQIANSLDASVGAKTTLSNHDFWRFAGTAYQNKNNNYQLRNNDRTQIFRNGKKEYIDLIWQSGGLPKTLKGNQAHN